MLSRFLPKSSHIRLLSNIYSKPPSIPLPPRISNPYLIIRPFSNNHGNDNNNKVGDKSAPTAWKLTGEDNDDDDNNFDEFFAVDSKDGGSTGISDSPRREERSWLEEEGGDEGGGVFERAEGVYQPRAAGHGDSEWLKEEGGDEGGSVFEIADEAVYRPRASGHGDSEWLKSEGEKTWNLEEGEESKIDDIFDIGGIREVASASEDWIGSNVSEASEERRILEREEMELTAVVKGQNRAFGDLIAASGITDDMLDSLIALKNFEGIDGLPPLSEIEDMRYEKNTRKSARAEIERQKQEEVAKARVRQVDEKGRAYGTGRRKCSIARVWIQPGEGKFLVNDKQFDVYFPMLDHRAALLRPFSETKTLGLWDIDCTVKGGGVSGQVGAIQLGISRALQNWEPDLRPPLKNSGFLTRDPRVVERKKPGKAKARKSFQWVKR